MDEAVGMDLPISIPHKRVLIIFGALVIVMLLSALDGTIVSTALPTIVGELGGLAHLSWVVTAYLLAQTIVTPVYGKLGDLYGRKKVLQVAVIVFLIGSALCGLSGTLTLTSAVGLIVGFALFGSVTFMPLYLQVIKGSSPTASGLEMLTMMGGVLVTSIGSGQLISRTGRYKIFPIVGTALMTASMFMLSRIGVETCVATVSLIMLVLGLGLGMVMQVLVIAVQNAVEYAYLGVATSGATLFRLIGGSLGTAVFGMIFATGLSANLTRMLPPGTDVSGISQGMAAQALGSIPAEIRQIYLEAFATSLSTVFLVATGFALFAFVLTLLLKETPLRRTIAAAEENVGNDVGQSFAMPPQTASDPHLLAGLSVFADRDVRRRYIQSIIDRAGVDLSVAEAFLLVNRLLY